MIQVEHLTRRFGDLYAVRDVSFHVARGEVVGFLGPNGAGKTTTMRILAGSLGASGGHARIGGHDVATEPRAVKRTLGYLPEHPPLYPTMTVSSYLTFAARIKGAEDPPAAVTRALGLTGLEGVSGRLLAHLSKGYQQRVGLAQALVHDPQVLVLDEPTSGLDPAQRKDIRDLIRELAAGDRTVILSTHVLPEVERLCQRVIIIAQGRIVAQDRMDALAGHRRQVRLQVGRPGEALEAALAAVPGVIEVQARPEGVYELLAEGDPRADVAQAAAPFGLLELLGRERLEDTFLRLTRDGEGPTDPGLEVQA
ncbi:MAG: ABC transporter ATP-binding protein [Pseudomonadota bacterium]